jgi:hypothetical protein
VIVGPVEIAGSKNGVMGKLKDKTAVKIHYSHCIIHKEVVKR